MTDAGAQTPTRLRAPAVNIGATTFAPVQTVADLMAFLVNNGTAVLGVVPVMDGGAGGFGFTQLLLDDNTDAVAPETTPRYAGEVARLTVYDFAGNVWNRALGVTDNADNQQAADLFSLLAVASRSQLWNGTTGYNRARDATASAVATQLGRGAALETGPGEWSVAHEPAAATRATITRAAGGAGVRHVCKSITVSLAVDDATPQGIVYARLRDGATGAGTVLWSCAIVVGGNDSKTVTLSDLNIVGSAATAMTLEFSAAPAANHYQTVSMSGYDADVS